MLMPENRQVLVLNPDLQPLLVHLPEKYVYRFGELFYNFDCESSLLLLPYQLFLKGLSGKGTNSVSPGTLENCCACHFRSEERRVGKECRSWWSGYE